jgi:F0F1-type ATP synthase assembly protein I
MTRKNGSERTGKKRMDTMPRFMLRGILIGLIVGAGLGSAVDNLPWGAGRGLILGTLVGRAIGALLVARKNRKTHSAHW